MYKILSILIICSLLQFGFNCKKSSDDSSSEESAPPVNAAVEASSLTGEWKGTAEVAKDGNKLLTASVQANFTENSYKIENKGKTTVNNEECDILVISEGSYTKTGDTITMQPTKETQNICDKDIESKLEKETYKYSLDGNSLILSLEEDGVTSTTSLQKL